MRITAYSYDRSGQISIDYMAGALVFFGAIIILISSVLNVAPQFGQTQHHNDLQLSGWSMSEVVMNDPGYWTNSTDNGTDWHHPANRPDVTIIGLQTRNQSGIDSQKVAALQEMDYNVLKQVLEFDHDFNLELTEFVYVDTHRTFENGSAPSFITEPTYPNDISSMIRYGTDTMRGTPYYFLLADSTGWYNNLWVSEDWDFTDNTTYYNLSTDRIISLNGTSYLVGIGDNQLSDGNLLVMSRQLGRTGGIPPQNTENIVEVRRFDVSRDKNVIKGVFRIW